MDGTALAQETRSQPDVTPGDATRCHGCAAAGDSFPEPLRRCSGCGKAWYHSQDCQRTHWKTHRPTCRANRPKKEDAHRYLNTTARSSPEARELMRTVNHHFPTSPTQMEGMAKPLRSLIYTGKDTPENMQLIFGPEWRRSLGKTYEDARIEILLDAPRGSPSYAMNQGLIGANRLERSPRPATESEKQLIGEVREMQYMMGSPSSNDTKAVLSSYGADWTSHLRTYMLAINTMDQGVQT
ncbi:hypothetical protein KVR01_000177 [Diaporthe batatas]|uniref:uncharacterized protein n=1 Tax=Diaporthe batatas TaxID=748121 RepID=UPI001D03E4B1|nr:uncharacterized protein KVR01_000177 [Diaporthe batatas]KAG8169432.1 hypothetical protein KVR01_000177 [Diaporthe batatas]